MSKRILNRALELWRKSGRRQRIAAAVAALALFAVMNRNGDDKSGEEQAAASGGLAFAAERQPGRDNLKTVTNSIGMEFVAIPKGNFVMGIAEKEAEALCRDMAATMVKAAEAFAAPFRDQIAPAMPEIFLNTTFGLSPEELRENTQLFCKYMHQLSSPPHRVAMTRPYYLGKHEVTQGQWVAVMGTNPSNTMGRTLPVTNVSWNEAQEFIRRLNEKEGHQGYRLPNEAEWEYAARAKAEGPLRGEGLPTYFGMSVVPKDWNELIDKVDDSTEIGASFVAYVKLMQALNMLPEFEISMKDLIPPLDAVGGRSPNSWGLHDMDGNAIEWMQDWYGAFSRAEEKDPKGPILGKGRTARIMGHVRFEAGPDYKEGALGFRLALNPDAVGAAERAVKELAEKKAARAAARDALLAKIPTHTNSIGMKFRRIPAGKFLMGCDPATGDRCEDGEKPRHEVTISRNFWLGQYEVTQAQWEAVMGNNPSKHKGPDRPVENVSWNDAQEFIRRLNEKEGHNRYRLPTEAEWEYAARAGTATPWFFGDDVTALGDYAWYGTVGYSSPVGRKEPNPWGLYDIHGNVFEWVQDWKGDYNGEPAVDPQGPENGKLRGVRGGGWAGNAEYCRAAYRAWNSPGGRYDFFGFRLAMDTEEVAALKAAQKKAAEEEAARRAAEEEAAKKAAEEEAARRAAAEKAARDAAIAKIPTHTNSIGMKFMRIPAGKFQMGSAEDKGDKRDKRESPKHPVEITRPFYLATTEVTQAQWAKVMNTNPSHFRGDDLPVENVSWNDAQAFIKKLNEKEGHERYRLPTEAEWEYAARAGSDTDWFFGGDPAQLDSYAWYEKNSGKTTHPVAKKEPNPWGLYDMYGNVWEFAADWFGDNYYSNSPAQDPEGPQRGKKRVVRGGCWGGKYGGAFDARSARRGTFPTGSARANTHGFRLAMSAE